MNACKTRPMFMNRVQAAEMLASHLSVYGGCRPLIFSLTHGGLEIAEILAESLNGEYALLTVDAASGAFSMNITKSAVLMLVDDGVGKHEEAAMLAALRTLRQCHPSELVCALPVAKVASLARIEQLVDSLVCLHGCDEIDNLARFYKHYAIAGVDEPSRTVDKFGLPIEGGMGFSI